MHDLDDLFAAARRTSPDMPPDLFARVMADAEAEAAERRRLVRRVPTTWSRLRGLFAGGFGATAGLATAALAGVWIGFVQPETVTSVADAWMTTDTVDLMPTYVFMGE
ncbi:dihydroorotate dehydrogenase [Falsirhodobacter algicola]|uniref:Dihydroorotate dehydrogenase n=1 Tax=Falsirhodobacter algicola TaxID=2692330 RepID=A0A8J8SJH6_9RHOB|nr:dihydroorotate dehydrogenase [Falsirhodobacter algicola]QUS34795.1 dihydroorotate dehydrogenase [Falsirhodobacter algicola]